MAQKSGNTPASGKKAPAVAVKGKEFFDRAG